MEADIDKSLSFYLLDKAKLGGGRGVRGRDEGNVHRERERMMTRGQKEERKTTE